jgi:hypothetical protein
VLLCGVYCGRLIGLVNINPVLEQNRLFFACAF